MTIDKTLITFKKIFGKPHTNPDRDFLVNEELYTGFQSSGQQIFSQDITDTPPTSLYSNNGVVEKVRLDLEFIEGTDSSDGRHGFKAKLPSDYETNSSNLKAGTDPFINDKFLATSDGKLQIIPESIGGINYRPILEDAASNEIHVLDERDWVLDSFSGLIYQENPNGTGADPGNPTFLTCWIYIGDMVSDAIFSGINPSNVINFDNTDAPQLTLKTLFPSDLIIEITVQVLSVFDSGFTMTIGFPADTDEIISIGEVDLQSTGIYNFDVYRISSVTETLTAYFQNSSAGGSGRIYIEQ